MRHPLRLSLLILPFGFVAGSAAALEVQRSTDVPAPVEEVWAAVGAFCSIADWHPDVSACELEEDDVTTYRTYETTDGATFRDQLMSHGADTQSYSYAMVESPLAVTGLIGDFEVGPGPDGTSFIVWQADFATLAVDQDEAESRIGEFFSRGLDAIRAMFEDS